MANELTEERANLLLTALNRTVDREGDLQILRKRDFIKKSAVDEMLDYLDKMSEHINPEYPGLETDIRILKEMLMLIIKESQNERK